MAKLTLRNRVDNLDKSKQDELIDAASNGETITSMSKRLGVDYDVVQTLLWDAGTLPWQGASQPAHVGSTPGRDEQPGFRELRTDLGRHQEYILCDRSRA